MRNRFDIPNLVVLHVIESRIDSKKKEKKKYSIKTEEEKPFFNRHFTTFLFLFSLCEFLSLSISSLNFYADGFSLEERDGDFLLRHMVQDDQKEFLKSQNKNKHTIL